jgi:hypothetical protein
VPVPPSRLSFCAPEKKVSLPPRPLRVTGPVKARVLNRFGLSPPVRKAVSKLERTSSPISLLRLVLVSR